PIELRSLTGSVHSTPIGAGPRFSSTGFIRSARSRGDAAQDWIRTSEKTLCILSDQRAVFAPMRLPVPYLYVCHRWPMTVTQAGYGKPEHVPRGRFVYDKAPFREQGAAFPEPLSRSRPHPPGARIKPLQRISRKRRPGPGCDGRGPLDALDARDRWS